MRPGEFKNKTVLVTGAGRGIGQALAMRLYEEGCNVVISDVSEERIKETAKEMPGCVYTVCDVTKLSDCEAMVEKAMETFGDVDYLISNAGILNSGAVDEINPEAWKAVIDVNLIGAFYMMRAVAPIMKKNRKGVIVQINSKSGKKGSYKSSAYAASKFGGLGLVQSLALEMAEYQVRVNAICPGNLMDSPLWTGSLNKQYAENRGITEAECRAMYDKQVPLGRTTSYDDVANAMFYLLSADSGYITGQALNVTGGMEMR